MREDWKRHERETQLPKLSELKSPACEGYYSKDYRTVPRVRWAKGNPG